MDFYVFLANASGLPWSGGWGAGQMVKNLPTMQETKVRSLGQEDPLGKGMATHSNMLAWRIQWTEEPSGSSGHNPQGHKELDMTERLSSAQQMLHLQ